MTERLVTEYTADTRNFRRGAQVYDRTLARQERLTNERLSRIDRRWERSTRSILNTRTALVGLTGYVGGAALSQLRSYAEQWRDVERRLQSIGAVSVEAQRGLVDLAIRTRSSVGGTAAAVQRLARSTGDGIELTTRRVETLQKLLATAGSSGSERASVSLQLGQALQSGVLSGDEFRSIRENAPVEFLDALAEAAGITRRELKDFAEDQRLTTDIVLNALDGLAETADARFSELAISGEEAFSVLTTGLVAYVGHVDETLGATASLNSAMAFLGEYMAGAGEGAETMAAAIQVVGAVAAATAGSRGLGAMNRALRQGAEGRRLNLSAAQAESRASRQAVIDAQTELAAKRAVRRERELAHQQQIFNDRGAVQSGRRRRAAILAEEQALNRLKTAQARATTASVALTAAQRQLSIATRVTTAAMPTMNGVMAFFGGPIGLAITATTLFVSLLASARTGAERLRDSLQDLSGTFSEIEAVNSTLATDYDALTTAQRQLAEATRDGGRAAVDAARDEIRAVNQRILANEALRRELVLQAQIRLSDARRALEQEEHRILDELRQSYAIVIGDIELGGAGIAYAELERYRNSLRATASQLRLNGAELSDLTREQRVAMQSTTEAQVRVEELENELEALAAGAVLASDGLDQASASARQLAADAAAAQAGVAGLIAAIPDLNRATRTQERLAEARANRDAALAGIRGQGLSGLERMEAEREVIALYQRAEAEITGTAEAIRNADRALDEYTDRAHLDSLSAREQAIERERRAFQELTTQMAEAGATQDALRQAEAAHAQRLQNIEERFREQRSAGGGGGRGSQNAERNLAAARELLVENGQRALFIEQALNAERQRLLELMPALISMGLSRADAEAVINSELERTERNLQRVKSASEQAAESFAKGMLSDIRHANNLSDAVGRISDRLLDLALDPVFDWLAQKFASLSGGGKGGGWFSRLLSAVFSAKGNAFTPQGVAAYAKGDVFRQPTMFQFGRGRLGVMAEEKPEAVMPLERDSKGRLGVIAQVPTTPSLAGGSVQANSSFTWSGDMNIYSESDAPQEVGSEVVEQMQALFQQMFSKQLGEAMRSGGALSTTFQRKAGF